MLVRTIEIWSDSFHEGNWCCENISIWARNENIDVEITYKYGFQPIYHLKSQEKQLDLIVYGSYGSWSPIPNKISELLRWGKPDFIAYDRENDNILFAVEETAATPTGNQALQRCERQYGSARYKIPYWYLISEFGVHLDGGVRRDSIWPSIAAIKLSLIYETPCIVLHYSDKSNPENYEKGNGLSLLFQSLFKMLKNHMYENSIMYDMKKDITTQYQDMLDFILSQWEKVIDFLPSNTLVRNSTTANEIAKIALNLPDKDRSKLQLLFEWPKTNQIPKHVYDKQKAKPLLKHDALAEKFERDNGNKHAYCLSNNAGSGKPPATEDLEQWINEQRELFENSQPLDPPAEFSMDIADFPETRHGSGRHHITTAKNIVYLYDSWNFLRDSIIEVYPRLAESLPILEADLPVFVYVSNSIKKGRLFGDPYTGQLSAYSTIFGKFDPDKRIVIAYFPHQVHTQAINSRRTNKGKTLMSELTDLIIFHGGVGVNLKSGEVY